MTGFQALLILLTLLQCGTVPKDPQRVFPLNNDIAKDGKKKLNQTSTKSIDVDDDDENVKGKSRKRDKNKIGPEEKIRSSNKKGKHNNKSMEDDEEDPFSKKKRRGTENDPNYTRNLDRTIDPFDDEEGGDIRVRGGKKTKNNYVN